MLSRRFNALLLVSMLIALLPAAASAQYAPWELAAMRGQGAAKDALAAVGTVSLKRPPTALRVHVELLGKGKTLAEALTNLKARRESAIAQLQTLKADKDAITCGNPTLSNIHSAQRRQLETMIAERMRSGGKKAAKGAKVPEVFTVSAMLTAEWPLEAKTPEELLLAAHALSEKVKAADLAGMKDAEKLAPEEEELFEEMNSMSRRGPGGDEPMPLGQPYFLYVARISEKDRQQALAEAFAKAKAQAAQLAQAAAVPLGPLVALSGQATGGSNNTSMEDEYMGGPYRQYMRRLRMQQAVENPDEQANEAVGVDPDSLTFMFMVNASFALGK
jgi:uncharacterized protein YggE